MNLGHRVFSQCKGDLFPSGVLIGNQRSRVPIYSLYLVLRTHYTPLDLDIRPLTTPERVNLGSLLTDFYTLTKTSFRLSWSTNTVLFLSPPSTYKVFPVTSHVWDEILASAPGDIWSVGNVVSSDLVCGRNCGTEHRRRPSTDVGRLYPRSKCPLWPKYFNH